MTTKEAAHKYSLIQKIRSALPLDCDTIECLICGRYFKSVCNHTRMAHGIRAHDYKQRFGISLQAGLIGKTTRERMRNLANDNEKLQRPAMQNTAGNKTATISNYRIIKNNKNQELWAARKPEFTMLWNDNIEAKEMSQKYNTSIDIIYYQARIFGICHRASISNKIRSKIYKRRDDFAQDIDDGLSIEDLAAKFQVSTKTIRNWRKEIVDQSQTKALSTIVGGERLKLTKVES